MDVVPPTPAPRQASGRFDFCQKSALLVVIAAGVGFSIALTVERPLWVDELIWIRTAEESSYAEMILRCNSHYETYDSVHPPLSYLLLKLSIDLAGSDTPWVVRLLPLLAGLACIPAAYLVGRQCHSGRLGLWAAAGLATAPLLVDQSAQAKNSSLILLFILLSLLGTVALIRGRARSLVYAGWLGVVLGVSLWNNQLALVSWGTAVVAVVAVMAVDLRAGRGLFRRQLLILFLVVGVAGVVGLPGFLNLLTVQLRRNFNATGSPGFAITVEEMRLSIPLPLPDSWRLVGLVAALAGLLWLLRRQGLVVVPLVAAAGLSLIFAYVLRQRQSFFTARYLTPLVPSLCFGLASYIVLPRRIAYQRAASLVLLGALVINLVGDGRLLGGWQDDYEYRAFGIVSGLRGELRPGDRLLFSPPYSDIFGRYLQLPVADGLPEQAGSATTWLVAVRIFTPEEAEGARKDAAALVRLYGHKPDMEWLAAHVGVGQSALVRVDPKDVAYQALRGANPAARPGPLGP